MSESMSPEFEEFVLIHDRISKQIFNGRSTIFVTVVYPHCAGVFVDDIWPITLNGSLEGVNPIRCAELPEYFADTDTTRAGADSKEYSLPLCEKHAAFARSLPPENIGVTNIRAIHQFNSHDTRPADTSDLPSGTTPRSARHRPARGRTRPATGNRYGQPRPPALLPRRSELSRMKITGAVVIPDVRTYPVLVVVVDEAPDQTIEPTRWRVSKSPVVWVVSQYGPFYHVNGASADLSAFEDNHVFGSFNSYFHDQMSDEVMQVQVVVAPGDGTERNLLIDNGMLGLRVRRVRTLLRKYDPKWNAVRDRSLNSLGMHAWKIVRKKVS